MINTIIQYLLGHSDDGDIFGVNQVLCRMHFSKPKNCPALSKPTDNVTTSTKLIFVLDDAPVNVGPAQNDSCTLSNVGQFAGQYALT